MRQNTTKTANSHASKQKPRNLPKGFRKELSSLFASIDRNVDSGKYVDDDKKEAK